MSHGKRKERSHDILDGKNKMRMILTPRVMVEPILSDASTLPYNVSGDVSMPELVDETCTDFEVPGTVDSDSESLSSMSDGEGLALPNIPDRPIETGRWKQPELDALLTAINVNRDAIKFHFSGAGGGKDVKRQAWIDVADYVNDVGDTHRTVKQCRLKVKDYTQRSKAKYNKLRYAVSQTGRGRIKKKLKLNDCEDKALDYLREEAVKGIPGIEVMDIGGPDIEKPSTKNNALLWAPDRDTRPKYESIEMKRSGVPKNYNDKNKARLLREEKLKNKKEHEKQMKKDRKKERSDARKAKRLLKHEMKEKRKEEARKKLKNDEDSNSKKLRKERKKERSKIREERKQLKAEKLARKAHKEAKKHKKKSK